MAISPNPAAGNAREQVVLIDHDVEALKALVAPLRGEFEFHATVSASDALALLDHKPIAAIVAGQKLFSTSGLELLNEARRRSPRTTRVLLADAQERKAVEQSRLDKSGIEILPRPCTAQQLKDVLQVAAWSSSVSSNETGEVEHVVMETAHDQPAIAESTGAPVTVLTTDANLYDAIRTAVQGRHETFLATRLQDAAELAAAGRCPVLVTDMALAQPALERIAKQLGAHESALVTVVVGNREQGNALMGLLGSGVIHRFLLKPVTPGLARLAIDSAARHHQGLLSAPRTAPAAKTKPTPLKPFTRPAPRVEPPAKAESTTDAFALSRPDPQSRTDALRTEPPPPRAPLVPPPKAPSAPPLKPAASSPPPKASPPPSPSAAAPKAPPPGAAQTTGPRFAPSPVLAAQRERDEGPDEDTTFELTAPLAVEVEAESAEPPVEETAAAPRRPKRIGAMVGAGLALGVLAAAGAGWWWWYQGSQPPPVDARGTAIQTHLAAAVAAFDAGRLIDPPTDSAAHYYAEVLKIDPANAPALDGLERIAERFIEQAENLMVEGRLDEAATALDAVRQVQPNHRRLRFLDTQLRKEQQDRLVLQAREAANAGDTRKAQELLAEAARIAPAKSGELDAVQESLTARERSQMVSRSLETARQRLAQGRLTLPANDSAKFHLRAAQRADPDSLAVQQSLRDLTERVLAAGLLAANERQYDTARNLLDEAEQLGASDEQLRALRASIEGPRLVANAQVAIGQRQFDNATRLLGEARTLGFQGPELAAADNALRAARGAGTGAAAGAPLAAPAGSAAPGAAAAAGVAAQGVASQAGAATQPAGSAQPGSTAQQRTTTPASGAGPSATVPKRIRAAVPEYPRRALEQSQQGWVDVSFGISPEGTVVDLRVESANPRGTFDRAALSAVRQWRFEPRPPDQAYTERIRTRVEFKLSDD
ncbi:MAG TPA: TonB family protein [Steroidobacteraceae bacterium]|nr:TonB family protein [Steroidobacteraceae bacterium]